MSAITDFEIENGVLKKYKGKGGDVTVPDGVTSISKEAFEHCRSLTSITIPDSVTDIGDSAFYGCSSLTSITIPEDVKKIGDRAFCCCSSLTSITIPEGVKKIGDRAFYCCSSLTSITIPANVKSIGYGAFEGCSSLMGITISPRNPAYHSYGNCLIETKTKCLIWGCVNSEIPSDGSVTSVGNYAFSQCEKLKSITIPESVTSIGEGAFRYCSSLTSITIPDSVTSIGGGAFEYCRSLTSITLPDSVTSIGDYAFAWCSSLTSITIPDGVTSIGDCAFDGCRSLTSITIPESVTSIGSKAFSGCRSLTSITIPEGVTSIGRGAFECCEKLKSLTIPDSVTSIGYGTFEGCSSLMGITISPRNPAYHSYGNCLIETKTKCLIRGCLNSEIPSDGTVTSIGKAAFSECHSLTSITIPESVTSIGDYAFCDCSSLTSLTIPDSVTSIGDDAFEYCKSLTSITIPDSVKSIGDEAFKDCSSLTRIILPEGLTSIGDWAFKDCSSLRSITIPDSVKSIGDGAFVYCRSLTSITIPDGVTSIGVEAFRGCRSLTSITIPDSVKSIGACAFRYCSRLTSITIPDSVTSIGYGAFKYCSSLTSITLPDSVTSIGEYAFHECKSLTSIILPDSVTSIGFAAFSDCNSLTSITFPGSVTSIGDYAFKVCRSLKSITIPEGVTSIGDEAFSGCRSLKSVTIPKNVTSIGNNAFKGVANVIGKEPYGAKICNGFIEDGLIYNDSSKTALLACTDRVGSVAIPEGVLSIGDGAFYGCKGVTSITIPESVTSIGDDAFAECDLLLSVTIPEAVLKTSKDKMLWLMTAAMTKDIPETVLKKCPKKLRPDVDQLLGLHELTTDDICSQIKKFPGKLRRYVEMLICSRDDMAAAGYFEKSNRLDAYAAIHNTDADTLRDSLLSDFGLDINGCRSWPLAGSAITAKLNSDLTLTLTDASGKVLKSVPKKNADPAEYDIAKKETAQLKKDVVSAAKLRNDRLLREFLSGRERDAESWKSAYLVNPLLRLLARLLVWQQGDSTFTLREDGTACDVNGNDFSIKDAPVFLAHPMELGREATEAWQKYFLDRGLKQPFEQVWEPVADADSVKAGRYDGCTVPLYTLMNKEKHGIVMEGQSRITLKDCSAGLKLIEGHSDWYNNEYEITDFTYDRFTRQVNHIVVHLDKATVAGRIKKDDTSVSRWLHLFTAAQITEFIDLASKSEATNCTALLLDYKNRTWPDIDPFAEFTLDLL